eukprot:c37591_g1_i1 orf=145-447(+)
MSRKCSCSEKKQETQKLLNKSIMLSIMSTNEDFEVVCVLDGKLCQVEVNFCYSCLKENHFFAKPEQSELFLLLGIVCRIVVGLCFSDELLSTYVACLLWQ